MYIENQCSNPPLGLIWQVRRSLQWINQSDLIGLNLICLMNEVPVSVGDSSGSGHVQGFYHFQTSESPPRISLAVKQIYSAIPSFLWWSTVPTLRISRTLAHEIAHHLIATRGYVIRAGESLENEELLADEYANAVLQSMKIQWTYKAGHWCIKELASWHFAFGLVDLREEKYKSASDRFLKAWDLNPDHKDAADFYWRTREMCGDA